MRKAPILSLITKRAFERMKAMRAAGATWRELERIEWECRDGIPRQFVKSTIQGVVSGAQRRYLRITARLTDEQWEREYMFGETA